MSQYARIIANAIMDDLELVTPEQLTKDIAAEMDPFAFRLVGTDRAIRKAKVTIVWDDGHEVTV